MVYQVILVKNDFCGSTKILSGFSFTDFFLQVRPKRSRSKPRPRPRPRWWPRRPRPGSSSRTPPWSKWFSRCCRSWRPKLQVRPFVYKTLLKFVLHGTEVAFLLLTRRFPKIDFDVAKIYQQRWVQESGQRLENVDPTHLVLASGKLVLQNYVYPQKARSRDIYSGIICLETRMWTCIPILIFIERYS